MMLKGLFLQGRGLFIYRVCLCGAGPSQLAKRVLGYRAQLASLFHFSFFSRIGICPTIILVNLRTA